MLLEASGRRLAHSPIAAGLPGRVDRSRISEAVAGRTRGTEPAAPGDRRGGNPGGRDQGNAAEAAGGFCSSRPGRPEADSPETWGQDAASAVVGTEDVLREAAAGSR